MQLSCYKTGLDYNACTMGDGNYCKLESFSGVWGNFGKNLNLDERFNTLNFIIINLKKVRSGFKVRCNK